MTSLLHHIVSLIECRSFKFQRENIHSTLVPPLFDFTFRKPYIAQSLGSNTNEKSEPTLRISAALSKSEKKSENDQNALSFQD